MIYNDRNAQRKIYDMSSGLFELSFQPYEKGEFFKVYATPKYYESHHKGLTLEGEKNIPRVLLVEDDESTRWQVRKTLKGLCDFSTAKDGQRAIDKIASFQPDIIFLDIGLPDKNGREVLKWVVSEHKNIHVVMFSADNNLDNISQTMHEGACGFIVKPFLKENLLHYIHTYSR